MRYAGLIIDMQQDCLALCDRVECEHLIEAVSDTATRLGKLGMPLLLTKYEYHGPLEPRISNAVLPYAHRTIHKRRNDAFWNTTLKERFREYAVDTLVFMGVSTSHCVRETAYSALLHSLSVTTAYDLIADTEDTPPNVTGFYHSWLESIGRLEKDRHTLLHSLL